MPNFESPDGTTLHYKDWGSGKPILFVHGNNLDSDAWEYPMPVMPISA